MSDAIIVDAVRTPVGRRGGQLANVRGDELLRVCLDGLVDRTGMDAAGVDDVVVGCVTATSEQGANVGRCAVLASDFPMTVPATTVNRLCGSGLQACNFAAQGVLAGTYQLAIGSGMENMTRVPMGSDVGDFHPRMTERYELVQQGISAELMAERWGLTREELDEFSYESHRRALHAISEGRFEQQIVPVTADGLAISTDEGPRSDTSLEKMAGLKPVFRSDGGLITAGSSSQISDGAAAVLIANEEKARELSMRPRARFVSMASVGVDPTLMLSGPIPATRKVLKMAGLSLDDIDLFEVNEAFASVPLAWAKELGVSLDKLNVNGGAISMGHPLGSTGARLLTMLLYELERQELRYGLVTLCIGFGQATATIIERL